MARVTLTIDDDVLRRIRARALALGTSPSVLLRAWLADCAAVEPARLLAQQLQHEALTPAPGRRASAERKAQVRGDDRRLRLVG